MTGAYAVSQARELLAEYLDLSDILQLYMFDEFGDHVPFSPTMLFRDEPYALFMTLGRAERVNGRFHFAPSDNFRNDKPEWLKQVNSEDMVNIKFYLAYIDSKSIANTVY
ncbi:hypothetical protein GGI00_000609 [Coemansia sp. RSA 2681]|nr:hypothetical protein GGI00_000609 [Coemansia sp. RSA 2681]